MTYDRGLMGTPNLNMNGHLRSPGMVNYAEICINQVNQKTSWRLGHQVIHKTSWKLGHQVNQKTSWRLGHQVIQTTSWRLGHQVNQNTSTDLVIRIRFLSVAVTIE